MFGVISRRNVVFLLLFGIFLSDVVSVDGCEAKKPSEEKQKAYATFLRKYGLDKTKTESKTVTISKEDWEKVSQKKCEDYEEGYRAGQHEMRQLALQAQKGLQEAVEILGGINTNGVITNVVMCLLFILAVIIHFMVFRRFNA